MTIPNKRPPILFCIGYYGHSNLGDEVSLSVLRSWLTEIAPFHEVKLSYRPRSLRYFLLNLLYLFKAELIIFGNGNLFQSLTSKRSFYFYLSLLFFARIFCKPVIALSQGIGPINRFELLLLSLISWRMVWCTRDGTHPKYVRLIDAADICEGSLDLFEFDPFSDKLTYTSAGHSSLLCSKQKTSFVTTDRLHIVIAALQCHVPFAYPNSNSKIDNYIEWTKKFSLQDRIRRKNKNKRILKWALRWQGSVNASPSRLLYSFNPIVMSSLNSNPFKPKQGLIDGLGVKIAPRFWGTSRLRGVDLTSQLLTQYYNSKILVWGMNNTTYQSYGCPWKHVSGYSDEISTENAVKEISAYNPDVVFICQSSPLQEQHGELLSHLLPHALIFLVGGSFDALFGKKKLLPTTLHTLGIEWIITILFHPKRIIRLPRVLLGTFKGFIKFS